MWKCKNCGEQLDKAFDSCWNCGYSRTSAKKTNPKNLESDQILPNGKLLSSVLASASQQLHPAQENAEEEQATRLIKCKECGSKISRKAEICPMCGYRVKAKTSGYFVGFFKLVGGIIGAIIGLVFAISFFSNTEKKVDPIRQIEISCNEHATAYPESEGRADYYKNCVAAARSVLRSQGLIQ